MKFNAQWNPFRPEKTESWQQWAVRITSYIGRLLDSLSQLINGQITFGNGTDFDNIKGEWRTVSTVGIPAGTEISVTHQLGVTPPGFILMVPPVGAYVSRGNTAWTKSHLYLQCSQTNQWFTIFVLAPPVTE
jgi:hypothetical protein